mmetsp:Transcript_19022/g.61241  ORF Transcript_19022/g.61241 Transcript_19022/m.61241 type:complete len:306 (-) Transcript_19022:1260-2177(-)
MGILNIEFVDVVVGGGGGVIGSDDLLFEGARERRGLGECSELPAKGRLVLGPGGSLAEEGLYVRKLEVQLLDRREVTYRRREPGRDGSLSRRHLRHDCRQRRSLAGPSSTRLLVGDDREAVAVEGLLLPQRRFRRSSAFRCRGGDFEEFRFAEEEPADVVEGIGVDGECDVALVVGHGREFPELDAEPVDAVPEKVEEDDDVMFVEGIEGVVEEVDEEDATAATELGDLTAVLGVDEDGERRVASQGERNRSRRAVRLDVPADESQVHDVLRSRVLAWVVGPPRRVPPPPIPSPPRPPRSRRRRR